jgi:ribosomal-protein-serine acetyltransferase
MVGQNKDAMRPQPLQISSGVSIIPVAVEHAVALASLVQTNIEHLAPFLPAVANLFSIEAANDHLCSALERVSEGGIFEWHLFVEGALCGSIRLKDIDRDDHKAKIGYFIDHRFAGRGIVTAAVRTVLGFCSGPLNLNRIELRCATGNAPSKRVAEKLGFMHEGILRQEEYLNGVFVDQHIYALLKQDFGLRPYATY